MANSTDVSDVKMTRFGYRVDLIRERHVRVKDEAKIASRGTDWDDRNKHTKQITAISIRKMALVCKWKKEPRKGPSTHKDEL